MTGKKSVLAKYLSDIGRKGGLKKTDAKTEAVQRNGRIAGRLNWSWCAQSKAPQDSRWHALADQNDFLPGQPTTPMLCGAAIRIPSIDDLKKRKVECAVCRRIIRETTK